MSDDSISDGLARLIFLDFLTRDQKYNLGEADFYDFVAYLCKQINTSEKYFAFFDKVDYKILLNESDPNSEPILEIEFSAEEPIYKLVNPRGEEEVLAPETQKIMGLGAMVVMNAFTAWETEELPKHQKEEVEDERIHLFLSTTDVTLKDEEREVIKNLLTRMVESRNYFYRYCENIAFELEFRATYPENAPKIPEGNSDEDTEGDDPFDWI